MSATEKAYLDDSDSDGEGVEMFMPAVLPPAPSYMRHASDSASAAKQGAGTEPTAAAALAPPPRRRQRSEDSLSGITTDLNSLVATTAVGAELYNDNATKGGNGEDAIEKGTLDDDEDDDGADFEQDDNGEAEDTVQRSGLSSTLARAPSKRRPLLLPTSSGGSPKKGNTLHVGHQRTRSEMPSGSSPPPPRTVPSPQQHPLRALKERQVDSASKVDLSSFSTISALLRFRAAAPNAAKTPYMTVLDARNKAQGELSFEKLSLRAEKIAQVLQKRHALPRGANVMLVFRKTDMLDFVPALFGTFFAESSAVPFVPAGTANDLADLKFVIENAKVGIVLTTEANHKSILKEAHARKFQLPENVVWVRTNDLGVYQPKKRGTLELIQVDPSEIAYIEYSRSVLGELRGVCVRHRSILAQCASLSASFALGSDSRIAVGMEARQRCGLWFGVFAGVWSGCHTLLTPTCEHSAAAGDFAWNGLGSMDGGGGGVLAAVSRHECTLAIFDYPTLLQVKDFSTKADKADAHSTTISGSDGAGAGSNNNGGGGREGRSSSFSSHKIVMSSGGAQPGFDLSKLQHLLLDLSPPNVRVPHTFLDELSQVLENWGCLGNVVQPLLSLAEFGGIVIASREGAAGLELVLDPDYLKKNAVQMLKARGVERKGAKGITLLDSGACAPLCNIAVVDGAFKRLPDMCIGELWAAAQFLPPSFHMSTTVQNSAFNGVLADAEGCRYLRTGYLGFTCSERVFVTGVLSERITSRKTLTGKDMVTYHYANDLSDTVLERVHGVRACLAFSVILNEEELVIVVAECKPSDSLSNLANLVTHVNRDVHLLEAYAVLLVGERTLPRYKDGFIDVETTRKYFDYGMLAPLHLTINAKTAVSRLESFEQLGGVAESADSYASAAAARSAGPLASPRVLDDNSGQNLLAFGSLSEILAWRAQTSPDDMAFLTLDLRGREAKGVTFGKLGAKVASLATFLTDKKHHLKRNQTVILFYPYGLDLVYALHACIHKGITAVVLPPYDPAKARLFASLLGELTERYPVAAVLGNGVTMELLQLLRKRKPADKAAASKPLPALIDTSKFPKAQARMDGDELINMDCAAVVNVHMDARGKTIRFMQLSGRCLLRQCITQRETFGISASRSIFSSVSDFAGLGLVYGLLVGVFAGAPTIMVPHMEFANHVQLWCECLDKFKVKDVFITTTLLEKELKHLKPLDQRAFSLHNVQNLFLTSESRPPLHLLGSVSAAFSQNRLEEKAVKLVYHSAVHPAIAIRDPAKTVVLEEMHVSLRYLQANRVVQVEPQSPGSVRLTESGRVLSQTEVVVVHAGSTSRVCDPLEVGEIWVSSTANYDGEFGYQGDEQVADGNGSSPFKLHLPQFPNEAFARTGDYGFLVAHGTGDDAHCSLYVLGGATDRVLWNGLQFYAMDLEATVDRAHTSVIPGSSLLLQHDVDSVILAVEISRAEAVLDCCSVIFNALLDEHQLVLAKIIFFEANALPRSGASGVECKQRASVLADYRAGVLVPKYTFTSS